MFEDYTFSLDCGNDLKNLISTVNREIHKKAVWFRANKLAVNMSKTKYIIFWMRGKNVDDNTPSLVYDENEPNTPYDPSLITPLERYHDAHKKTDCRSYKLLGIHLDEHLSLNAHTNQIVSKLSRSLYYIKQAKHIILARGLKSLYFALIHSHLTYCTPIMSCITKKNQAKNNKNTEESHLHHD
jgi:hypothetical protein